MPRAHLKEVDPTQPHALNERVWARFPEEGAIDFYLEDGRFERTKYLLVRTCASKAEARAAVTVFIAVVLPPFIDVCIYRLSQ